MPLPTQKPGDEPKRVEPVLPPQQLRSPEEDDTRTPSLESNNEFKEETEASEDFGTPAYASEETTEAPEGKMLPQPVQPAVFENVTAPVIQTQPVAQTATDEDVEDFSEAIEENKRKEIIKSLDKNARENAKRLLERISDDESSEVLLNGPTEIMFKVNGQRFYDRNIQFEDIETYHKVINSLILHETDTDGRIGKDSYLIEGQLELPDYNNPNNPPLFARVHVIAPPVVKAAKVTIAKKAKNQFGIDDLANKQAMSPAMASFLKALARGRATVVFSGLSGSGKTTLLEAMSHHFDENDRVVVVEDTSELRLPLPDVVSLLSTSRKPGQNPAEIVSLEWLVSQANRMRPDRIIVGEIRGGELAEFLSAANSGADGSMTTVHASSPRQTLDKMLSLAMKSPTAKNEQSVLRDISSTVQIIVQTSLVDGRHVISQIEEISDTVLQSGAGIATTPIFQFDRNTGAFLATGRPSDKLTQFLGQRGVKVEPTWFGRGL